jgi:acetyl-CoA C-acetyltransferase
MSSEARAPVLVGVGQMLHRVDAPDSSGYAEPLEMMERVARLAAEDAGCPRLLSRLDSIRVPRGLWPYSNPGHALRERFGASDARTAIAPVSGNMVQHMLTDAAREIAAGRMDAVLVVGAEAEHSKRRARRAGQDLGWSDLESPAPDQDFDAGALWILPEEVKAGLAEAAAIFTLYENARRFARGESLAENRDRIARLWHGFAEVAENNPHAWTREAPALETIRDDSPDNRMISWPYTKRLCSNMVVDQAAAVIMCSAELATRMAIPRSRWVFLETATDCMATPFMSNRMDFLRVPALELAGQRALELTTRTPEEIEYVDLYSCFPAAVQVAAEALGLSLQRPLTMTGGLAYAGGPFNSYVLHALATAVDRLRSDPGSHALVSSVGGAFNKHAFGIYSSEPPTAGFQYADLDLEAKKLPRRELRKTFNGSAIVETYTLRHEGGVPSLGTVACLLEDGSRVWARSEVPEILAEMRSQETCGRIAQIEKGVLLGLR